MFFRLIIIFIFLAAQLFPFFVYAVPKNLTIVVQALHDGSEDEASDKTAEILRQKIRDKTPLYVVEPQKVDAVLSYYKNYQQYSGISSLEEAKDLLVRAKEHYFQFAYLEAQAELKKAIQIFENNSNLVLEEGQVVLDSWITLALVHNALGAKEEAASDFQNVLQLNPFYHLDAKSFAPSIYRLFGDIKNKFQEGKSGSVEITADPKVSEIYLNGIYQGVSPSTLSPLPEGGYTLSFKANNYQSVHRHILIGPGQKLRLKPKLFWIGQKGQNKNALAKAERGRRQIEEGLRIAELLKVDKVLLVDVNSSSITARLVDRRYRSGHNPIIVELDPETKDLEKNLDQLVRLVFAQTELDLLKNPRAYLDPDGLGDPILLGRRHQKIPKGLLFGGLGAVGLAGLLAGILSAGGSGSGPSTGTLALSFK